MGGGWRELPGILPLLLSYSDWKCPRVVVAVKCKSPSLTSCFSIFFQIRKYLVVSSRVLGNQLTSSLLGSGCRERCRRMISVSAPCSLPGDPIDRVWPTREVLWWSNWDNYLRIICLRTSGYQLGKVIPLMIFGGIQLEAKNNVNIRDGLAVIWLKDQGNSVQHTA